MTYIERYVLSVGGYLPIITIILRDVPILLCIRYIIQTDSCKQVRTYVWDDDFLTATATANAKQNKIFAKKMQPATRKRNETVFHFFFFVSVSAESGSGTVVGMRLRDKQFGHSDNRTVFGVSFQYCLFISFNTAIWEGKGQMVPQSVNSIW